MSTPAKTPITKLELIQTNAAMLALTTLFVVARVGIHIYRRKSIELHDFFIYFAYVLYLALWICYRIVINPMFRAYAVYSGEVPPYPTIMQDAAQMLRLITAAQMCFYTSLLGVKLSLLTLYRKLLKGLPSVYYKIWWTIVAVVVLSWLGSVLSSIFTCDDLNAKFNQGKCGGTPNEAQRVIFSLYFAYAVDVLTDLMVMILPFHLTWNLQMPRGQKTGIFILFGTGFVCILFATLRVVKLGVDGAGRATMPEPKWMLLWTVLETSIAVIIGCSPAFAVIIRKHLQTRHASRSGRGYNTQPSTSGDVKMKGMSSSAGRQRRVSNGAFWEEGHSSQEALAKDSGGILVTTTVHQEGGHGHHGQGT
ncbi:hypothetical protein SVAN01_06591 [Stagonosporopsis vannaccii]|nr:hypothetical protein SVAN01_06591 [Stagonosporopsis vannaccii]